jgi:hypothetical protein
MTRDTKLAIIISALIVVFLTTLLSYNWQELKKAEEARNQQYAQCLETMPSSECVLESNFMLLPFAYAQLSILKGVLYER